MTSIRVGVLRGGPSDEYEVSMRTGASVLEHLPKEKYKSLDVVISRDGEWLLGGRARAPQDVLHQVDVVFNALHGAYGEDGSLQKYLDQHGVRYTGSGALASAIGMHKALTKERVKAHGVKQARHLVVELDEGSDPHAIARQAFGTFAPPYVMKRLRGGSSVGLDMAKTPAELAQKLSEREGEWIIEEYIMGKEATCAVVDGFRGEDVYVLPPIEIVPEAGKKFFDYDAKYSGKSDEICPGRFTREESEMIQKMAKTVHEALGLRHYSRSDFIVARHGIYFLEVNTLPGLTSESLLPKALKAVGATHADFLDHVVSQALARR